MTHAFRRSLVAALSLVAAAAAPLAAQPIKGTGKLKAEAKIKGDSAKKIALAQVPNGKIRSGEIEHEKGKLIYSFDIKVPGKSGIEEVNVDAMTGAVVGTEHESAASEAAEKKAEAKGTKKP